MQKVKISGMGVYLPKETVEFHGAKRFRANKDETHLFMLVESAKKALEDSHMTINDIDCIIGAVAFGLQPLPCTASLIHEALSPQKNIPSFDVNSTCTSFITALDLVSLMIEQGRYKNVLIVSGDLSSIALNPNEPHSYELFSDGCVSAVISKSETKDHGILYATQFTYSKGAHFTEVYGGGTTLSPHQMNPSNKEKFLFHMEGKNAIVLAIQMGLELFDDIKKNSPVPLKDIQMFIPHQASNALDSMMKRLHIPDEKYINIVKDYGNMVSASVPFSLYYAIDKGKVKRGDLVLLMGTAAGMSVNAMIFKY